MIIRIGVDILDVLRIERAILKYGQRFLDKVYTEKEQIHCNYRPNKHESYTAYYTVKEAVMKVLGTGSAFMAPNKGQGVFFREIEVLHENTGAPIVKLYGRAKEAAEKLGIEQVLVSMSHEKNYAIGFAVGEKQA